MNSKVKHYFASYINSNQCFETSDGLLFHAETDAIAHSNTLKDEKVQSYTRDEYQASLKADNEPGKDKKKDKKKPAESGQDSDTQNSEEELNKVTKD